MHFTKRIDLFAFIAYLELVELFGCVDCFSSKALFLQLFFSASFPPLTLLLPLLDRIPCFSEAFHSFFPFTFFLFF